MADEANRDLLPITESSCIDTCRSNILDSRERHAVCKLDRYQLEDRYLRLRDEVHQLKKLSNSQEEKIKRLGTKLMRVAATPRPCLATALDFNNDENRVDSLERENAKLKDKITVLRNQILNHTIVGRPPSRSRRLQICNFSGPTTCRSEIGRLKNSSSHLIRDRDDQNDSQTFLTKIEDLEMQKNEMTSRIADLENQLAEIKIGNQREKAAENVEYIRVWRQMNLQKEQLAAAQVANASMTAQIRDLNALLEEKNKSNKEIADALLAENKKLADIEEQLGKAKDSQSTLREKDEQIKDLTSEMQILHQHNAELLALSSKCSQVELENVDLKKKISEQLSDNQSLKNAFANEQTNFTALQAANEQLMAKLLDLQKNIDGLTIQLKSQNERQERSRLEHEKVRTVDRQTSTVSLAEKLVGSSEEDSVRRSETYKNCCEATRERVPTPPTKNFVDREVQTENDFLDKIKDSPSEKNPKKSSIRDSLGVQHSSVRDLPSKPDNGSGNLTPDEMLKILEQAQINTPLEMQDAARIRQIASTNSTKYVDSVESGERQSSFRSTRKPDQTKFNDDPWKILLIMYRVLREFANEPDPFPSTSSRAPLDPGSIDLQQNNIHYSLDTQANDDPIVGQSFSSFRDENNNQVQATIEQDKNQASTETIDIHDGQRSNVRFGVGAETEQEANRESIKSINIHGEEPSNEKIREPQSRLDQLSIESFKNENVGCMPTSNSENGASKSLHKSIHKTCSENEDCGYECVRRISEIEDRPDQAKYLHCLCDLASNPFKNVVRDTNASTQNRYDSIHRSRTMRAEGTLDGSDQALRICRDNTKSKSDSSREPKAVVYRKANRADEAIVSRTPYPVLITNDQSLLEIHIVRLKLPSAQASAILCAEEWIEELTLCVSWNVWNQRTAFTPFLRYPRYHFDTSSVYQLTDLFEFFDGAISRSVPFWIHVPRPDKNGFYPVAKANLSLRDILDYPGKELHYVADFTSILPTSRGSEFGRLSLWIKLSCDPDKVRIFKKRKARDSAGHCALSKFEIPKRHLNSNIERERSSASASKPQFLKLHESIGKSSVNAELSSKNPSESSTIGNISVVKTRKLSRHSKDSETSSSTQERSTLNGTPINNASQPGVSSAADSYITISPSPARQSDSSNIKAMEDEDATSSDFRNGQKKHDTGDLDSRVTEEETRTKEEDSSKTESASIDEFNDLLRNGNIMSARESTSSVQDLSSVITDNNWSEYKRRSLASQPKSPKISIQPPNAETGGRNSYPFSVRSTSNNDVVIMRIESLSLFQRCSVLADPEIHQLYVEFSFLGYRGVDLETISVPKPSRDSSALFNYMRQFEIDEEQHPMQRSIMRAMMTDNCNPTIKFTVVSEPLQEEMDTKECVEVGYAYFNIRDHIMSHRFKEATLTIMNAEETESIGTLKITLLGADAIRRCLSDR